uniref:Uncharacterized protein n=1 Tax=Anguilla anguilla TaxID=7936 RepID=A0A0E9Q8X1_ANGAN
MYAEYLLKLKSLRSCMHTLSSQPTDHVCFICCVGPQNLNTCLSLQSFPKLA